MLYKGVYHKMQIVIRTAKYSWKLNENLIEGVEICTLYEDPFLVWFWIFTGTAHKGFIF